MMQTTLDSFTAKPKPVRNRKGYAHPNPNGTSWCGPTALTVLTGKRYDIIEKDLLSKKANKHRKYIKGMYNHEMNNALRRYGYSMSHASLHGCQTFRQWTKEQAQTLEARGQAPIVVNRVHPAVETAKAMLTANRPSFSAAPREDSDNKVAQVKSALLSNM